MGNSLRLPWLRSAEPQYRAANSTDEGRMCLERVQKRSRVFEGCMDEVETRSAENDHLIESHAAKFVKLIDLMQEKAKEEILLRKASATKRVLRDCAPITHLHNTALRKKTPPKQAFSIISRQFKHMMMLLSAESTNIVQHATGFVFSSASLPPRPGVSLPFFVATDGNAESFGPFLINSHIPIKYHNKRQIHMSASINIAQSTKSSACTVTCIAVHPRTGLVYVGEISRHCIMVFGSSLSFVREFGKYGSGPGDLRRPVHLDFSADGALLAVVDSGKNAVQIYRDDGRFLWAVGSTCDTAFGMVYPRAAAFGVCGSLFVLDTRNSCVRKYDDEGKACLIFGDALSDAPIGSASDICVTQSGRVCILSSGLNTIRCFDGQGLWLADYENAPLVTDISRIMRGPDDGILVLHNHTRLSLVDAQGRVGSAAVREAGSVAAVNVDGCFYWVGTDGRVLRRD